MLRAVRGVCPFSRCWFAVVSTAQICSILLFLYALFVLWMQLNATLGISTDDILLGAYLEFMVLIWVSAVLILICHFVQERRDNSEKQFVAVFAQSTIAQTLYQCLAILMAGVIVNGVYLLNVWAIKSSYIANPTLRRVQPLALEWTFWEIFVVPTGFVLFAGSCCIVISLFIEVLKKRNNDFECQAKDIL